MRIKYYLTIIAIFLVNCSSNIPELPSKPQEVSPLNEINEVSSKDSFEGVQFFMDGMMFFEQGDYARAILELSLIHI